MAKASQGVELAGLLVLLGLSIATTIYTNSQAKKKMIKKLFLKIEDELENKFAQGTEFILLDQPNRKIVNLDEFSLQCLIIPPRDVTPNSLGARLITIDHFTRSFGCRIRYYKINFNPTQGMNPQVDLTQYANVYPKEELFQNLRRDVRYVQEVQILGTADREDVDWFVQWQLDNEEFNTRYETDRQKAAIDMIALEVERLVKKQENALMFNGNSNSNSMNGYMPQIQPNPKKRSRSKAKPKATKMSASQRKQIACASQNKRRSLLVKRR